MQFQIRARYGHLEVSYDATDGSRLKEEKWYFDSKPPHAGVSCPQLSEVLAYMLVSSSELHDNVQYLTGHIRAVASYHFVD